MDADDTIRSEEDPLVPQWTPAGHLEEPTLHGWLDGAFLPADARMVEAHVAACRECAARTAEVRGVIAATTAIVRQLDIESEAGLRMPASGTNPSRDGRRRVWYRQRGVLSLAAVLLFAVSIRSIARLGGGLLPPPSPPDIKMPADSKSDADAAPIPGPPVEAEPNVAPSISPLRDSPPSDEEDGAFRMAAPPPPSDVGLRARELSGVAEPAADGCYLVFAEGGDGDVMPSLVRLAFPGSPESPVTAVWYVDPSDGGAPLGQGPLVGTTTDSLTASGTFGPGTAVVLVRDGSGWHGRFTGLGGARSSGIPFRLRPVNPAQCPAEPFLILPTR